MCGLNTSGGNCVAWGPVSWSGGQSDGGEPSQSTPNFGLRLSCARLPCVVTKTQSLGFERLSRTGVRDRGKH